MVLFQSKIEKMKIIVPFRSYQPRNRKFQKNGKKIQKIRKHHYGFIPSENRLENTEKERKKNRFDEFLPATE